jgi:hypothetical protein
MKMHVVYTAEKTSVENTAKKTQFCTLARWPILYIIPWRPSFIYNQEASCGGVYILQGRNSLEYTVRKFLRCFQTDLRVFRSNIVSRSSRAREYFLNGILCIVDSPDLLRVIYYHLKLSHGMSWTQNPWFGMRRILATRRTPPPPKIGKNLIVWRKIVIFHTKYPKHFRASLRSAQFF